MNTDTPLQLYIEIVWLEIVQRGGYVSCTFYNEIKLKTLIDIWSDNHTTTYTNSRSEHHEFNVHYTHTNTKTNKFTVQEYGILNLAEKYSCVVGGIFLFWTKVMCQISRL